MSVTASFSLKAVSCNPWYSGQGTNNAKGIGLVSGDDVFNLRTVEY